jgi:uncharacterized membrane protein
MQKLKNDHYVTVPTTEQPRSRSRVGAWLLIIAGVVLLLMSTGALSPDAVGNFFGNLGGSIGAFFGNLGSSLANLWPLALIVIGLFLLFWRRQPADTHQR